MATYKIISDNVAGKQAGDTITDEELNGCSVDALIVSGHIQKTTTKKVEAE